MVNDGVEIYIMTFAVTARVSFRKAGGTHPLDLFLVTPLIEVVETLILRYKPLPHPCFSVQVKCPLPWFSIIILLCLLIIIDHEIGEDSSKVSASNVLVSFFCSVLTCELRFILMYSV